MPNPDQRREAAKETARQAWKSATGKWPRRSGFEAAIAAYDAALGKHEHELSICNDSGTGEPIVYCNECRRVVGSLAEAALGVNEPERLAAIESLESVVEMVARFANIGEKQAGEWLDRHLTAIRSLLDRAALGGGAEDEIEAGQIWLSGSGGERFEVVKGGELPALVMLSDEPPRRERAFEASYMRRNMRLERSSEPRQAEGHTLTRIPNGDETRAVTCSCGWSSPGHLSGADAIRTADEHLTRTVLHPEPRQDQPVDRASGEAKLNQALRPCFVASNGDTLMLTDEQAENVSRILSEHPETDEREATRLSRARRVEAERAANESLSQWNLSSDPGPPISRSQTRDIYRTAFWDGAEWDRLSSADEAAPSPCRKRRRRNERRAGLGEG